MNVPVSHTDKGAPSRQLTLFDSVCIIVGIIIGAGIYETTPIVAGCVGSPLGLITVWALGGAIALIGSICYAELATTYPVEGGDYVYLSRAFGKRIGFLFAWAEYWIIRPGNVGMMAFVFARFAYNLSPITQQSSQFDYLLYACSAIFILTGLNLLGVRAGKTTQNILTVIKVTGLIAIFVVGVFLVPKTGPLFAVEAPVESTNYQLAIILVLFTYGGWNEMSYVAAEVKNPKQNIFRALFLGTLAITVIYVAVNIAFLNGVGLVGTRNSSAIAADLLQIRFGERAGNMMSTLVCLSCLGSINGMVFTGSRVFYAAGNDHQIVRWLGKWHARLDTPLRALMLQLLVTIALVIGFGSYDQGFDRLLHFTTPVFWSFATLVAISLFVLRWKEPDAHRPVRAFLYPLTPILFCASSAFLFYSSFTYALANRSIEARWTIGILIVGVIVSLFSGSKRED